MSAQTHRWSRTQRAKYQATILAKKRIQAPIAPKELITSTQLETLTQAFWNGMSLTDKVDMMLTYLNCSNDGE